MKICLLTEHYPPHIGGVEIVFEEYARRLNQLGHEIRVITSNSGGITGEKNVYGIKIYYLKCRSFFGHPILPIKEIKDHIQWADIVHTTTYTAALPTVKLCNKFKKPCVLMVHEVLGKKWFFVEKNPLIAFGFLFFEWFVITKKYDAWHVISKATKKDLEQYSVPKDKIKLIYHGIDSKIWNSNVIPSKLFKLFGFKKSDKIFLYNGRPGKTKGIFILFDAICKAKNHIPKEFKFGFILSKKPETERKQFEKIVAKHKLQNLIKIIDPLPYDQLPTFRKDSYAFIVPSLTEGFGFNAAEVSAIDTPLIVSDAGSLTEVSSGKVLFFENGNSDDLALKIQLAIKNKFKHVNKKEFNWDDSVKKILSLYQELTK